MRKPLPAVAAAIAGGLMTLSFAPYNLWWCGLLSLGLLAWLLAPGPKAPNLSGKITFWVALC